MSLVIQRTPTRIPSSTSLIDPKNVSLAEIAIVKNTLNRVPTRFHLPEINNQQCFCRQIQTESGASLYAVSPKHAWGRMQILPPTAREVATNLLKPNTPLYHAVSLTLSNKERHQITAIKETPSLVKNNVAMNIFFGIIYQLELNRRISDNPKFAKLSNIEKCAIALASYNWGGKHVNDLIKIHGTTQWSGHLPLESRDYLAKIMGQTSAELVSLAKHRPVLSRNEARIKIAHLGIIPAKPIAYSAATLMTSVVVDSKNKKHANIYSIANTYKDRFPGHFRAVDALIAYNADRGNNIPDVLKSGFKVLIPPRQPS